MLERCSVRDVVVHATSWGEVGHRGNCPEVRERRNIWRGSRRVSGRFRSLYLPPSYPDCSQSADVTEEAVVNPRCLWDCHSVSPSNEPNHCQN